MMNVTCESAQADEALLDDTGHWPIPTADEIVVATLSGIGQIGMNWTLYGHDGRWVLVDAGVGFPKDCSDTTIRAFMPDPALLQPILPVLDALVVTHGHEDHIGAIAHLWPHHIDCPIFATPFAAGLIRSKLTEFAGPDAVSLVEFQPGVTLSIGQFRIETVPMTHSVPQPVALAIHTKAGTVLHSGDWKLDPKPLIGQPTDLEQLAAIGRRGVLAAVCDSTNAGRDLEETSEADVLEAFTSIMRDAPGLVVICCFASNVARVASAAKAAFAAGRQTALTGRSMRTAEGVADKLGLLNDAPPFLAEPGHLEGLSRREMALVCTGAQGEANAVLARLSKGRSRHLPRLSAGDTVVISARTIPGNEPAVDAILDDLRRAGVTVITSATLIDGKPVHVTGHAGRREMRALYELVAPRTLIPVHGEAEHLEQHAELATEMQIPTIRPAAGGFISVGLSSPARRLPHSLRVGVLPIRD